MSNKSTQEHIPPESIIRPYANWLWRFFSSIRLALILILIIAALVLLGALTPLNIFNSIYFAVPGIMLMLNILVCSLNRWKSINLILRGGEIVQPESFYTTGMEVKGIHLPASEAAAVTEKVLRARGYRVRKSTGDAIHMAADKNHYFRLGTYLSHFSLILFVVAFLLGFHYGFRDTGFAVVDGQTKQVGHNTGLETKLISFTSQQYANGMPKDYSSRVILYEGGQQVKEALIRVNHPLYYKGTRFYQSFFGTAVKLLIHDGQGQTIFDDNVLLSTDSGNSQYSDGFVDLPGQGFTVRLINSSAPNDTMIPAGDIAIGIIQQSQQISMKLVPLNTPIVINGLEFTFQGLPNYSGFQVSRDPTNAIIWIASGLFLAGICAVFYFPYRQLRVLFRTEENEGSLSLHAVGRSGSESNTEVNGIIKEIEKKLPPHNS